MSVTGDVDLVPIRISESPLDWKTARVSIQELEHATGLELTVELVNE
jgi:hypothetical protein